MIESLQEKSIQLAPQLLETFYLSKGRMHYGLGDIPGAVKVYDKALAIADSLIFPHDHSHFNARKYYASVLWEKGRCSSVLGDYPVAGQLIDKAIIEWSSLVEKQPNNLETHSVYRWG